MRLLYFWKKYILASALSLVAGIACAQNIVPFTSSSFDSIKEQYQGKEFLLGLWSVDCPPCLVELELMSSLLELNPDLHFVLISTDSIELQEEATVFLEDFDLVNRSSWMFADNFVEKLRYSIDPNWFGELPRSYYFDTEHNMRSHSGILTESILKSWFANRISY